MLVVDGGGVEAGAEAPMWLPQRRQTGGVGARAAWRIPITVRAFLREHGDPKFEVDMVDLSRTGFRIETARRLHPSTRVWLTLPGFAAREAAVVWHREYHYGFAFAQALHPAVFTHIVAQCRH